jgi:hypothetical protein
MKKYFAKYLPIEGEIQDRLRALYAPSHKEYKAPVTLFLCSRDIQVGDKVTYMDNYHGVVEITNEPKALYQITTPEGIHYIYKKDSVWVFKVIGEISSAARWIKEGDEFDEYQLLYKDEDGGLWEDLSGLGESGYAGSITNVCRVKCPTCGSFE